MGEVFNCFELVQWLDARGTRMLPASCNDYSTMISHRKISFVLCPLSNCFTFTQIFPRPPFPWPLAELICCCLVLLCAAVVAGFCVAV